MINIAVCDDDKKELTIINNFLKEFSARYNDREFKIDIYNSSFDLSEELQRGKSYDLYLLDIIMPDIDGIKLGEEIRQGQEDAFIIYLTTSEEFALEAYQVMAFNYLLKPLDKQIFNNILHKAIAKIDNDNKKRITVKTKNGSVILENRQIVCAEYCNHAVIYSLDNSAEIISNTSRESFDVMIKELLDDNRFLKCHKSYIVNMNYIKEINRKNFVLKNDIIIPIASANYKNTKQKFFDFLLEGKDL